ncbi:hypothetical protein Tco_0638634, partial [Tanacetum coccineum]
MFLLASRVFKASVTRRLIIPSIVAGVIPERVLVIVLHHKTSHM